MRRSRGVSCSWARGRMDLFGGEDLSRREDAALRAHLVACMDCRKELRPVVRMRRALRDAFPPDRIPAGMTPTFPVDRGFFAAMHRAIMVQVGSISLPALPTPRRRLGVGLAGAAALFLTGMGLVTLTERPPVNLLERAPIQAMALAVDDQHSLLVTVGHRSAWQGLMGRWKASRRLIWEGQLRRGEAPPSPAARSTKRR